jgi:Acetyltransferases, including N-acetylases of ribosomal proteins
MTDEGVLLRQLPDSMTDGLVVLDAHRIDDAEAHHLGEDEEMRRRFDAERPATLDETREAIERWIAGRAAGAPMFAYALRNPSGRLIGGCELRMRSMDSANVSYWLFPSFRGHGYAVRALSLLSDAANRVAGLNRLELRVSPENHASRRVAEKAAFACAGTVEEEVRTGVLRTMLFYIKEARGT